LPPSDTLSIRIGYYFTDGLEGGDGFFIHYKNKKFIIEPYQRRHRTIYEEKSRFKIIKQELKLNKENYCLGDSLYGWVYFHINETNKAWDGKVKIEHYASGYFRAIVKKICFGN